jgi:hypothetical protein
MYGDRPEPVAAATAFVAAHFPEASAAFVGGSVLTEHRTPTSDLDVTVVLGDGVVVASSGLRAPYRDTLEHDGWVVEAFVHDRASLEHYMAKDVARRVPTMMRLVAESEVLVDRDGIAAGLRARARELLDAGPPPYDASELAMARYLLTDLLDDLAGSEQEDELVYLANEVVTETAWLALVSGGHWSGKGKALARMLREIDPDLAERLVDGHRHVVVYGDTAVLHRAAVDVLLRVGGPLLVGHRLTGETDASR